MSHSGINTNWNNDNSDMIDKCDECGAFRESFMVKYKGKKMDICERCRRAEKDRTIKRKIKRR